MSYTVNTRTINAPPTVMLVNTDHAQLCEEACVLYAAGYNVVVVLWGDGPESEVKLPRNTPFFHRHTIAEMARVPFLAHVDAVLVKSDKAGYDGERLLWSMHDVEGLGLRSSSKHLQYPWDRGKFTTFPEKWSVADMGRYLCDQVRDHGRGCR